jgi:flagellar motor switch protein FliG
MDGEMAESVEVEKKLTGIQKAAIFLIALGPRESGQILKLLPEEEADRVAKAIARLEHATQKDVEYSLFEYNQFVTSQKLLVRGGIDYAQKVLVEAYGSEVAARLVAKLNNSMETDLGYFDNFRKVDPQQLAKFIQDEHPQTIALILSHLEPTHAANLIHALPQEIRNDIAVRMAELSEISPEIVRNISKVIDQKLRNLGEISRQQFGGVRAVANIFNRLDPTTCSQILQSLEADKPQLFENIRRFMFVFRDLENLDEGSIKTLITKVDRKALVIALKGANESLRNKFIKTQSQRGAEMLMDDITSSGPVKLKDVDVAQQQIIATARELEKQGLISLGGGEAEQVIE